MRCLLLLPLFLFTVNVSAQLDDLFYDQPWYLSIVGTGDDFFSFNPNDEINKIQLDFFNESNNSATFTTSVCKQASALLETMNDNEFRIVNNELTYMSESCEIPDNTAIEDLYFEFYETNENEFFHCDIIWIDGHGEFPDDLVLQVNKPNGDYLLYSAYGPFLNTDTFNKLRVSVYPNPVDDVLHIENNNGEKITITIVDVAGSIVKKVDVVNETEILFSQLKAGVYFAEIISQNGNKRVEKIIKN